MNKINIEGKPKPLIWQEGKAFSNKEGYWALNGSYSVPSKGLNWIEHGTMEESRQAAEQHNQKENTLTFEIDLQEIYKAIDGHFIAYRDTVSVKELVVKIVNNIKKQIEDK